jgi:hypothetical protein
MSRPRSTAARRRAGANDLKHQGRAFRFPTVAGRAWNPSVADYSRESERSFPVVIILFDAVWRLF